MREPKDMDHDEADFGDNFFGEEDEAPVDMEVVREGMKLVPLSDMCFGEPDAVMNVESSMREHILSPLGLMLPEQLNFQGSTKQGIGGQAANYPQKNNFGDGSGKELLKHAKVEPNEIGMEAGGVSTAAAKVAAEIGANVLTGGVVAEAGPRPDFSSWTVEDDLMLKNAMEAGAAMEALAKGAVMFSQRYTVRELRERWRALLYDPEVSEQAAIRMLKSEPTVTNPGKISCLNKAKDPREFLRKRKLNSVRTHYYKMRKRIAAEKLSDDLLPNIEVEAVPNKIPNDSICGDSSPFLSSSQVCAFGSMDPVVKEQEPSMDANTVSQMVQILSVGGVGVVVQAMPSGTVSDPLHKDTTFTRLLPQEGPHSQTLQSIVRLELPGQETNEKLESGQEPAPVNDGSNACSTISDTRFRTADQNISDPTGPVKSSSESIIELSVQGDIMNKQPDKALDAVLDQKFLTQRLEIADISPCPIGLILKSVPESSGMTTEDLVYDSELPIPECQSGEPNDTNICSELGVSQTPSNSETPVCKQVICLLNTEDTDIPSPPPGSSIGSPSFFSSAFALLEMEGEEYESSISGEAYEGTDDFDISPNEFMLPASENKSDLFRAITIGKREATLDCQDSSRNYPFDAQGLTAAVQSATLDVFAQKDDEEVILPLGNAGIRINRSCGLVMAARGTTNGKSFPEEPGSAIDHLSKSFSNLPEVSENEMAPASQIGVYGQIDQELCCTDQTNDIVTTTNGSCAPQENYDEYFESEEEMPSFSDVEAMILDMDLDPAFDEDVSARAESRRLYKRHRKTFVRLEQGTNAALERSLSLRGAIAVLYGHHLRYFITRNEVLLGRMTQDNMVDIDLGKEGRANKVSRRQANIKLKEDGVFYLKNLGRRALTVNNIPIATGQHASLGSNCLIEVGGMRFVFEINKKLVRQRMAELIFSRQHG